MHSRAEIVEVSESVSFILDMKQNYERTSKTKYFGKTTKKYFLLM